MGAMGQELVTFYGPRTLGSSRDPERDTTAALQVRTWLKQISSQDAKSVLGILTHTAYVCRFELPAGETTDLAAGWTMLDTSGHEYAVRGVRRTRQMYTVTMERA